MENISERLQALHTFINGVSTKYENYNIKNHIKNQIRIEFTGPGIKPLSYVIGYNEKHLEAGTFKRALDIRGFEETGKSFKDKRRFSEKSESEIKIDDGNFNSLRKMIAKASYSGCKRYNIGTPEVKDNYASVSVGFYGGIDRLSIKINYKESGMDGFKPGEAYSGEIEGGAAAYEKGGIEKIKFMMEKESELSASQHTDGRKGRKWQQSTLSKKPSSGVDITSMPAGVKYTAQSSMSHYVRFSPQPGFRGK